MRAARLFLLQAVRFSQSVLSKERNTIVNDFAADKKVRDAVQYLLARFVGSCIGCVLHSALMLASLQAVA